MYEISVKEARSHLSELLDRVENGEAVVILRHGKKVACLVTADRSRPQIPKLGE